MTVPEELTSIQQSQQIRLFLGKLIHRARFRCFVRSPPEQLRTVAESIGGHVVKTYFDDELGIAKSAHHAIRTAEVFNLLHPVTLARSVVHVAPLGDNAVERWTRFGEPFSSLDQLERRRRQTNAVLMEIGGGESFQSVSPFAEWLVQ
jgi:hypothetical protein